MHFVVRKINKTGNRIAEAGDEMIKQELNVEVVHNSTLPVPIFTSTYICINNTLPRHNRPKARLGDDPRAHWDFQKRQKQKDNTQDSNVVPHRSTN